MNDKNKLFFSLTDRIGENTDIDPSVEMLVKNNPKDGRGIRIGSHCMIYPRNRFVLGDLEHNRDADLCIGDNVHINAGGYISGEGGVSIGDDVLIGPNTCILSAGHVYGDPNQPIRTQPLSYAPIRIGRDVWIGGSSVILQGVSIGDGAVVGAGSVVCKDVPSLAVLVGNPGRIVKYRGDRSSENVFTRIMKWVRRKRN
ncbi:MAG: hypothetical protein B6245_06040 [Desulfobacteraceae bacterium 4572_88]|nr:MAG: hypothetical protein B6245_06040 [Desulfobacteraceae bacterium 4572_88]